MAKAENPIISLAQLRQNIDDRAAAIAAIQKAAAADAAALEEGRVVVPAAEAPTVKERDLQRLTLAVQAQARLGLSPERKLRRKRKRKSPEHKSRPGRKTASPEPGSTTPAAELMRRKDLIALLHETHPDRTPKQIGIRIAGLSKSPDFPQRDGGKRGYAPDQVQFIADRLIPTSKKGAD